MSEIAQAFVRIRPDTRGFSSEAEGGLRSAFGRLARIAAGAFAVKETFDFGKEIISHAADVQKQIEAVGSTFGKAGEEVLKFNENGAKGLGISAHLADTTSARFGILFKNLGIGGDQAAKMTIGFEKLAGSLSSIRGVDPSITLRNLPLAVAGNLRSLKQLGIATDQTQLKLAAFKLGLTTSVTQALTPAQRAIAIYAVATGHLGEFQAEAAKHSDDLVNRERVLQATWDNAKDALGRGLLPAFTRLATIAANVLPRAIEIVGHAFRDLREDIQDIAKIVGPAISPIIDEFKNLFGEFRANGIEGLVDGFRRLSPAAKLAAVAVGAIATAFTISFVGALGPIASVVLALGGLGIGLREAYNRSAAFRADVAKLGAIFREQVEPALKRFADAAARAFQYVLDRLGPVFRDIRNNVGPIFDDILSIIRGFVGIAVGLWNHFGSLITKIAKNDLAGVIGIIRGAIQVIRGIFDTLAGLIHGDWGKVWSGLKEIVHGALSAIEADILVPVHNIEAIFESMWRQIELLFLRGIQSVVGLLAKIPSVSAHIPGVGTVGFKNPFKGINDSLKATIDGIKNTSSRATREVPAAVSEAAAKAAHGVAASAAQSVSDSSKTVAAATTKASDENAKSITALTDKLNTTVAAQDAGIAKARAKVRTLGQQIAAAIQQQTSDVADAVSQANQNLVSIGQSLSSSIGQILDAPLQRQQQAASAAANRQNLENLRRSVILPGGGQLARDPQRALAQLEALSRRAGNSNRAAIQSFIGQYQQALAAVRGDQVSAIKDRTQRSINDLTDALARGKINLATFRRRLLAELTRDHVSYKRAGSLLGTSFANGFRDQVEGILSQASAIAAVPAGKRGAAFSTVSIVKPLDTLRRDQQAIAKLTHSKMDAQTALQKRIAKAAEASAALQSKLAAVVVNTDAVSKSKNGTGKTSDALKGTTR